MLSVFFPALPALCLTVVAANAAAPHVGFLPMPAPSPTTSSPLRQSQPGLVAPPRKAAQGFRYFFGSPPLECPALPVHVFSGLLRRNFSVRMHWLLPLSYPQPPPLERTLTLASFTD